MPAARWRPSPTSSTSTITCASSRCCSTARWTPTTATSSPTPRAPGWAWSCGVMRPRSTRCEAARARPAQPAPWPLPEDALGADGSERRGPGLRDLPRALQGIVGDKWMWTPIALTPPLTAAGIAGFFSERHARTTLPAVSALYALDGAIGVITHVRGVYRKPGGFSEPTYNLVMGPPLLAPGSLALVGGMGIVAALARREG